MTEDLRPPFRQQFDNARDPYTARNALGITSTGGGGPSGGAPDDAQYIVAATDPTLTAERVLTNTASITWDFSVAGQAKANTAGGGNVSNSGTPTSGQYAKWTTATTIQGVAPATVLSDIGAQPAGSYQPLDGDLTAIAALTGTNTIYYRSATNTWSPVNVSTGLAFSGGNLTATASGGGVVRIANVPFLASGTWTKNANLIGIQVEVWGAGGGGSVAISNPGGGAGGYARKWYLASALGSTVTVTIGAGAANANGGTTTFAAAAAVSASGGVAGGAGGSGSGGDLNLSGRTGNSGISGATVGPGGDAPFMGGGAPGGGTVAGGAPNTGGGGASGASAAGGSGLCIVTEFYSV